MTLEPVRCRGHMPMLRVEPQAMAALKFWGRIQRDIDMEVNPVIRLVGIECGPEAAPEFNKWLEEVHIPMLLKCEGIKRITRYELSTAPGERNLVFSTKEYPNYLTIIEFENEEAFEAYKASSLRAETLADAHKTGAKIDFQRKWRVEYKRLRTWSKKS